MEQITLDLIPNGSLPVLHASQYDDGRQWKVNLTENGEDYTLSDETIVLDVRKGDGCAVTCAVAVESGKKYVILTSTEQMCAVAGQNLAELQITKGSMKIGTLNFILQVERDPLNGSISSSSEIHDLQHQVDECVDNALADLGASGLPYDNTESGLEATNVQQAIDEVNEKASDIASELDDKADKSNTYTKTEVNDIADTKADANNVYAKSETYTKTEVDTLIRNLPEPMIFKGTLGVGGTITELPTASTSNEGYTYKVITDGTYAGQSAKSGDVFVSNGSAWVLIPSGDEDNDTWRAIKVNGVEKLGNAISSGSVDFVDTTNVKFEFDSNGNAVKATLNGIDTSSEVDAKVEALIDDDTTASNKAWSSQKITDELIALLPVDSASGSIVNFSTSLALPLVSLKASIVATESGSGTKSPTNPYTLGGFSNAVIYQTSGLEDYLYGVTKGTYRAVALSDLTWTTTGTANVYLGSLDSQGQFVAQSNGNTITDFASSDYTLEKVYLASAIPNKQISKVSASDYRVIVRDDDCTSLTSFENSLSGKYIIFKLITPITPTITPAQYQALCTAFGITATQTTLALGQTVYGGEIVLTKKASGYGVKLRVYPHYPSYNGETLTGKWLSSMDNYVAGTTPTIGADVVDLSGAVYTEIDLTDASDIVALVGVNNVWSDTGDVEVRFKVGIQEYIDKQIASTQALIL